MRVQINTQNWTCDFKIGRVLWAAYQAARAGQFAVAGVRRSSELGGFVPERVLRELAKYYIPAVGDGPVAPDVASRRVQAVRERVPGAFVIGVDLRPGSPHEHGMLEISGDVLTEELLEDHVAPELYAQRPPGAGAADAAVTGAAAARAGEWRAWGFDVTIACIVDPDTSRKAWERLLCESAEMIVDGILRFAWKTGHDHVQIARAARLGGRR